MKREKRAEYRTDIFGFPVVILDAPMRKTTAGWALDISPEMLQSSLLRALAHKPAPLSGNEIRFIRQSLDMTLVDFGNRFDVSHAGVMAWEKCGGEPTSMKWPTEKDIRLLILTSLHGGHKEISETYRELEHKPKPSEVETPVTIDAHLLVAKSAKDRSASATR